VWREAEAEFLETVEKGFHFVEQACVLGLQQHSERAFQRKVMRASDVSRKAVVKYHDSTMRFEPEHQDLCFTWPQVREQRESLL